MPKEIIFLVEESTDGGYEARALGYSIFTDGETLDEVKKNIQDAVRCHFEKIDKPLLLRIHFVKDEFITV
ncbi:MAG: type II toxin-antitoxin system HicB family antitoxin [Dissulfuribacterales bacterium]